MQAGVLLSTLQIIFELYLPSFSNVLKIMPRFSTTEYSKKTHITKFMAKDQQRGSQSVLQ